MTKVYFVVYFSICFYASYLLNNHHYTIAFLVFFFGIPVGMFWLHRHNRDKLLKKQELKKPTFYDDFKNDFSFLTIVAEKVTKAFKISIIWGFKTISKCLKHIFSFKTLKIMWDILLLLLYGAWLLVYYFFGFIVGLMCIIGLISGIISFFGSF